jgi:NAD(P)-dependent dehydrogenase (short-subunit alcohol dehydrogenase family)
VERVHGRTVLITGAAGGIGAALAQAMLEAGAHVALADVDPARLAEVASGLRGSGRVSTHVLDVRDVAAWSATAAAIEAAHGGLDVLVHNAGVTVHGAFAEQRLEDLEWLLDVNLRGVVRGTHLLLPLLRRSERAQLVLISSMSALFGTPAQAAYCASKAGVRALGAALRVELAVEGIGVTTVLPGTIATPFLARARTSAPDESRWMAEQMLAWGTRPETVARAVVRGVQRDRAEVRVGWDCVAMDLSQRWLPSLVPTALRWGWRIRAGRAS